MAELRANQKVDLTFRGVGVAQGDTTQQFVGGVSWSVDPALLALTPDATTLACQAVALGQVGTTTVAVTARDTRGNAFTASVTIEITPVLENTDHVEIVVGTPVDQ